MLGAIVGDIVGSVYEWGNIKTKDFPFKKIDFFIALGSNSDQGFFLVSTRMIKLGIYIKLLIDKHISKL